METSNTWSNGAVRERQCPDVCLDRLQACNLACREVCPDDLDARSQERAEVGALGEGVADLEHAAGRPQPGEHPRHLDDTLVRVGRSLEPANALAAPPRAQAQRNGVVQLLHAPELVARRELADQRRARERPFRELREGPLQGLLVRVAAQQQPERSLHERFVRPTLHGQLGLEPRVAHP